MTLPFPRPGTAPEPPALPSPPPSYATPAPASTALSAHAWVTPTAAATSPLLRVCPMLTPFPSCAPWPRARDLSPPPSGHPVSGRWSWGWGSSRSRRARRSAARGRRRSRSLFPCRHRRHGCSPPPLKEGDLEEMSCHGRAEKRSGTCVGQAGGVAGDEGQVFPLLGEGPLPGRLHQ